MKSLMVLVFLFGCTGSRLRGRVALVTGASRGIGRGIALGLAEQGATIYVTGRSLETETSTEKALGGTLSSLVEEINALGGQGRAIQCDHSVDAQVAAAFEQVARDCGGLDLLVNNAFQAPSRPDGQEDGDLLFRDFWEQPGWFYDQLMNVGLRSHYIASVNAVPLLRTAAEKAKDNGGPAPMIVHISSFGGVSYSFNVAYGVGKAGVDRMASDMSRELAKLGVDCVSVWPGVVRTERMVTLLDSGEFEKRTGLFYPPQLIESPRLTGRVIASLFLADRDKRAKRNGRVQVVAEVARAEGVVDVSGMQPPSIRSLRSLIPAIVLGKMGATSRESEQGRSIESLLTSWTPDFLIPMSLMSGGAPAQDQQE